MSFVTTHARNAGVRGRRTAKHRLCSGRREYGGGSPDDRGGSRGCGRGVGADGGAVRRTRSPVPGDGAQAIAIHELFVSALGTSAGSYAATEAANAAAVH